VSMGDNRGERKREIQATDRTLDRRALLLTSTAFAAASAIGAEAEIVQIGSGRPKGRVVLASYPRERDVQPHQRAPKATDNPPPARGRVALKLRDWS